MNTYCKIYKLKKDRVKDYIDCHANISDEQVRTLKKAGAENLEIYMWGEYCIITYECIEFGKYLDNLSRSEENARWQCVVGPMFEETPVLEGRDKIKPLEKIFSLKQAYKDLEGGR